MSKSCRPYVDIMALHDGVTGSCNLVIVKFPDGNTVRFVVDCGLFQEKEYENLNRQLPFDAKNIDFCLVTHVHIDHIGRLPYMVKKGFYKNIYATEPTCKFMPAALGDSYKVLASVSKRKNEKCLYSDGDVRRTLELLKPCKYNEAIMPCGDNIKVTFFKNGHLIGSALVLVQISYYGCADINLLFTGDYNNKNIFFDVPKLPQWVLDLPLTVIQESTYGDMESSEIVECFEKNILKCLKRDGTVVALVFSLGRAQEILYKIKTMQEEGKIDELIPIYFDGKLAIKYTKMYINDELGIKPEMKDFLPKNLQIIEGPDMRNDVLVDVNKKIIVTTSGMGTYGPAQTYIPEYIIRDKALIQFTGYTAEGTMGYKLKETMNDDLVEIGGVLVKKRAEVEYTTENSAHAKADVMLDFLKQLKILLVLFNHGRPETKKKIAERAAREIEAKHVGILGRQYFFRVDCYGLVKTLSTKFE